MTILNQLKQLYKDGFKIDSDRYIDYFFSVIKPNNRIFLFEDNQIISAAYINPKDAFIFGKKQKIAYLSAISTLTPFRGKKKIAKVINFALNKMNKNGFSYVALNPFDYNYYKKYDFCDVSFCKKVLLNGEKYFDICKASKKDVLIMQAIEQAMFSKYNNFLISSKKRIVSQFNEFSVDNINAYIVKNNNIPFAYYFDEGQEINCYATTNIQDLFNAQALSGKKINDFSQNQKPFIQIRIVNILKSLLEFDYSNCADTLKSIQITDNIIDSNNLCLEICVKNGKAKITKTQSAEICVDISYLTEKIFYNSKNIFVDRY